MDSELEYVRERLAPLPGSFDNFQRFYNGEDEYCSAILRDALNRIKANRVQSLALGDTGNIDHIQRGMDQLINGWVQEQYGAPLDDDESEPWQQPDFSIPEAAAYLSEDLKKTF